MRNRNPFTAIDWLSLLMMLFCATAGLLAIYAVEFKGETDVFPDFSKSYGKQFIWVIASLFVGIIILILDSKIYTTLAYLFYGLCLLLLLVVLAFGKTVAGSQSWISLFGFNLQPAEIAKVGTILALAKYLSALNVSLKTLKGKVASLGLIAIPMALILLQGDFGSAIVFGALFLALYREGFPEWVLWMVFALAVLFIAALIIPMGFLLASLVVIWAVLSYLIRKNRQLMTGIAFLAIMAIAFSLSVDYVFDNVLKPHQRSRVNVWLGVETDMKGAGYNVNQSLIAIGSGGLTGQGFLNGTQTKFDFVPEQRTDFIFSTIGEEYGFVGSFLLIGTFIALLLRLIFLAERQRSAFSRIYIYGAVSILFFHFTANVGMAIGLMPVIGIPFPFVSYGGSAFLAFFVMVILALKLDAERLAILR